MTRTPSPLTGPLSPAQIATARKMRADGATWEEIGAFLGRARRTAVKIAKAEGFYAKAARPAPKPRPRKFGSDVSAEFLRLWTTTRTPPPTICAILLERFGITVSTYALRRLAGRLDAPRPPAMRANAPTASWEAMALARLDRRVEDNAVRRVERGTFAAEGFSMIGGRI